MYQINFIIYALFRFDPTMFTQMMAAGAVAGNTGGKREDSLFENY